MSLKRPGGEAAPVVKEDPAAKEARRVFSAVSVPEHVPTKKTTVSFQVDPRDYALLKQAAEDMGIGTGAAIRVSIREFLKRKGLV